MASAEGSTKAFSGSPLTRSQRREARGGSCGAVPTAVLPGRTPPPRAALLCMQGRLHRQSESGLQLEMCSTAPWAELPCEGATPVPRCLSRPAAAPAAALATSARERSAPAVGQTLFLTTPTIAWHALVRPAAPERRGRRRHGRQEGPNGSSWLESLLIVHNRDADRGRTPAKAGNACSRATHKFA